MPCPREIPATLRRFGPRRLQVCERMSSNLVGLSLCRCFSDNFFCRCPQAGTIELEFKKRQEVCGNHGGSRVKLSALWLLSG